MSNDEFLQDFDREAQCLYDPETYSVRDNGSVFRHSPAGKRPRPIDNFWTFGKPNSKTGYMEIASVRVHRIVATAFHGQAPTRQHVVDHIDTNKRNNRAENLRWVTRLENILLNPITVKRIEGVCGSVEAFLADPAKYKDEFKVQNYGWMCTVSRQDAKTSLERLQAWAKSDKRPSGGSLGEWIFNRYNPQSQDMEALDIPTPSKTPNAIQKNWRIPSEFPCCPREILDNGKSSYFNNLISGSVFCQNDLYTSLLVKRGLGTNGDSIIVLTENKDGESAIKPWAVAEITFENSLFVHTSIGTYFTPEGAEKYFCLAQGLEWLGEDSIDDYC